MMQRLLSNHVLANAFFMVVLIAGSITYFQLPREQDPEINFNWINILTNLPGASAEDVEKLVTEPLESAIHNIPDIRFVSSTSRDNTSTIFIRFNDLSEREFDKRINDLRREVQNKANAELPEQADDPMVMEFTTSNSMPIATVVVSGMASDEILRGTAKNVGDDLERIKGVEKVRAAAFQDPELHVAFDPAVLEARGIRPTQVADSLRAYFRDTSAGDIKIGDKQWLLRLVGTNADPAFIGKIPLLGTQQKVLLDQIADISIGYPDPDSKVLYQDQPSVMYAVLKRPYVNTLELVERINQYIEQKNKIIEHLGVKVTLIDDQTSTTRNALSVMQRNALVGLLLVMFVTWLFLGAHVSLFMGIGIPFTLAGTFWMLNVFGQTLNQSVLIGIVIVLGMLVDDSVVIVESIYYRLQRGAAVMTAAIEGIREVFLPVTASVLTTVAAFLPLMLLPGIMGDFLFVVPFVVIVALLISLLEAYWILPVHVSSVKNNIHVARGLHKHRIELTRKLRNYYGRVLARSLRRPVLYGSLLLVIMFMAVASYALGLVKVQFFSFDPLRIFYINVTMPPGTTLDDTLKQVHRIEAVVKQHVRPEELRATSAVAGQMYTEMEQLFGEKYGHVVVSLNPDHEGMREVQAIVGDMRDEVMAAAAGAHAYFFILSGGPPTGKPISIKVRGDDFAELEAAVTALRGLLADIPAVSDIGDNNSMGKLQMKLLYDSEAMHRAGISPDELSRQLRLLIDGEIVASTQHQGEEWQVRVLAKRYRAIRDVDAVLEKSIIIPSGASMPLGQLVTITTSPGRDAIRHYNFRRTITVEADLNKELLDTVEANRLVQKKWADINLQYPGVSLDFTGELDDIAESFDAMLLSFFIGVGLIYLILGTQFVSYFQPFMILVTVPLALAGVTFGLVSSQNPLSLFTMYGVVALVGISVNASIVLIDAANARLRAGQSVLHATIYAARRRVIPIIVTSLTTIAGLFSLATGLGGKSLMWGPVAAAIVWGLAFSTLLTLFVIPYLYQFFMRRRPHGIKFYAYFWLRLASGIFLPAWQLITLRVLRRFLFDKKKENNR